MRAFPRRGSFFSRKAAGVAAAALNGDRQRAVRLNFQARLL